MDCSTPGFPVLHHLLELAQTHIHWVSDAIQSHPLSPLFLPSIFPSIRLFSIELVLRIKWSNYWRFSFSISPSNEYSGLISFRIDWFDILVVQGTLKNLLQHHNSKPSIHRQSPFFNPLQCSCLENPRDRGGWWVTQSQTWLKQLSSSSGTLLYGSTLTSTHGHWKSPKFDYTDLCWQEMSLPFNTPSGFVIAFLLRNKCLLVSWLQSPSAVILELRS